MGQLRGREDPAPVLPPRPQQEATYWTGRKAGRFRARRVSVSLLLEGWGDIRKAEVMTTVSAGAATTER